LRAALAGADPALIQDALYDAEDHLRAEATANPGMSEAELLEHITRTYGAPDEVAAAYLDTEVKVAAALQPPMFRRAQPPSVLSRFFSVYSDPSAYMSLFFMFLGLATGCLYFTFAVTGLALSLGLSILIFGLPVFLGFIALTRVISLGEGRLLEAVSGERMPRRPVHPSAPDGLVARILATLKDARTWATLLYFVIMLPLGVLYFTAAVTGLSLGVSFFTIPIVGISQRFDWWLPWDRADVGIIQFTPAWLDTPAGWVFDVVFGVVILTTLLHVARGVVSVHARTAKTLLVLQGR
jgi:Putative sensor